MHQRADSPGYHPCIDQLIRVRFQDRRYLFLGAEGRRYWRTACHTLRRMSYDVAVDLQGLLRSGWISMMSRAPIRIGFPRGLARESLNVLFSNVRPTTIPIRGHVIDRNLGLLHPLGIFTRDRSTLLRATDEQTPVWHWFRNEQVRPGALRAAINPAAGWPTKQWPAERFARIADRLTREMEAQVFILWGPGERALAEKVRGLMVESALVIPEMDIAALMAFLGQCDILVSGDSGPLHLAASLGKAVVGLFGPSDPVRNGPFLTPSRVVSSSCRCHPCLRRACPENGCMETISVQQVWQALSELKEEI